MERNHHCSHKSVLRGETKQKLWLHCKPGGHQRKNQAASALRWTGKSSPTNFSLRQVPQEITSFVRPSAPDFTRQHHQTCSQTGPTVLGNLSFLLLAVSKEAPSTVMLRGLGTPSRRRENTIVVSMASWAPWCNGRPSATTSKRLVSERS